MASRCTSPQAISEAVDLATRFAPAARYIAGGTDLVIQINRKKVAPHHLIALGQLPGLVGIAETPMAIRWER